jgi:broad specificity phosphatase PhoE
VGDTGHDRNGMPVRLAELVIVRHGESVGNLAAAAAGEKGLARLELDYRDPDTPLSDNGVAQADALGRHVSQLPDDARPEVVLGSPYVRAASTMEHALGGWPSAPHPVLDERLRERDLGLFDGLTGQGIRDTYPEEAKRREVMGKFYYRPPGGESWTDVVLRVRGVLGDLDQAHAGRRVWVFTHQAVIMAFRYLLESLTEEELLDIDGSTPLANCSLTRYRPADAGGGLRLVGYGDVEHLEASDAEPTHEEPHGLGQAATAGDRS